MKSLTSATLGKYLGYAGAVGVLLIGFMKPSQTTGGKVVDGFFIGITMTLVLTGIKLVSSPSFPLKVRRTQATK